MRFKKTVWLTVVAVLMAGVGQQSHAAKQPTGYALAAAHPLAVMAGEEIFAAGGNAFDAAVAVSAALSVVEPYSSGLGGGGFWLLHIADGARDVMIDGRETAPQAAHRDMYLDKDGKVVPGLSLDGPLAAGVPGMPAALAHIANNYGKLPLSKTLAPAIRYAKEGFAVHRGYVDMLSKRLDILKRFASSARVFLDNGKAPEVGWHLRQPDLAGTLEAMAQRGHDGFYRGRVAGEIVAATRAAGGIWTTEDLAHYRVVERRPVKFEYRGAKFTVASLPSSGGIVLAGIFNMLSLLPDSGKGKTSVQTKHYLIEVMRRAYRDRARFLGDPDFVEVPLSRLLSMEYAKRLVAGIDPHRATPSNQLGHVSGAPDTSGGRDTTHFSIIDAQGNRVGATTSINYGFGSAFIAGRSGVLLNNEMDDFVAKPGTPNVYGLVGGKANAIEPGKRMLSSMSPTFIDNGERIAIIGTPGGSRIITMVLLGALTFLDGGGADIIAGLPRFHHQYLPDEVQFEPGAITQSERTMLEKAGHRLRPLDMTYGNMNVVVWDYTTNELSAASDPRGYGVGTSMPAVTH